MYGYILSSPAPPGESKDSNEDDWRRRLNVGGLALSFQDPVNGIQMVFLPTHSGTRKSRRKSPKIHCSHTSHTSDYGSSTSNSRADLTTVSKCIFENMPLRCGHSRCLATPHSILHIWMWIFDAVFMMHQPANGKPAPPFFFGSRDMTDATTWKNTKSTINWLKKKVWGEEQAFR